ncbi:SPOR domain-containing protein [Sphingomonas montana]|uniref:SPOR domain-containing protein n=1 Tax=Sphingomonas montana TaxID=1843236 RepID=UPI00096E151A|nr:SPOR domain-containing protein [Sphingomonas montana]
MSDIERGRTAGDDDRLPWLEPVEEDRGSAPGTGKTIAALLVALLVIGLVVGGIFWLSASRPGTASGDLIAAPEGDYKVKPDQPGGMKVEGEGETAFAASDGRETNASIDLSAIPEAPVAGAGSVTTADAASGGLGIRPVTPSPAAAPAPASSAGAVVRPAPVAQARPAPVVAPVTAAPAVTAGGGQVQLGAFGSEAKANAAWKTLSGRFAFLAPLAKAVTPVEVGGKTLYRLRAGTGAQAASICARLKVAGETCSVVG